MRKLLKLILIVFFAILQAPNAFAMKGILKKLFSKKTKTTSVEIEIVDFNRFKHKSVAPMVPRAGDFLEGEFHLVRSNKKKLILKGKDPAGYIIYYCKGQILRDNSEERIGFVSSFEIFEKFRRQGLGRKLLDYSVDQMFKDKADYIKLHTYLNNIPAVKLYKSVGFEEKDSKGFITPFINVKEYPRLLNLGMNFSLIELLV